MADVFHPSPALPPPSNSTPVTRWLRQNFFGSPFSIVITLASLYLLWMIVPPLIDWAWVKSVWTGSDRSACEASPDGACWLAIRVRFWQIMLGLFYGSHPAEIWRPVTVFVVLVALIVTLLSARSTRQIKFVTGVVTLVLFPLFAWALLHGGWLGLEIAPTSQWGGLMLTLVLATGGIVLALPLGILLALGRRSSLPVVRWLSIIFIEFWRANPLITILFMASNLLPLFFPADVDLDKVGRALVAITLFQSAYTAEAIRGGLAAIPAGQYEAARALGMGYAQTMALIILPQALKISIPSIVNTFIALFKDTTLVSIIGLLDVFRMSQTVSRSIEWKGYDYETYIFSALVFFVCCYGMSRYSRSLETRLDTGHKT